MIAALASRRLLLLAIAAMLIAQSSLVAGEHCVSETDLSGKWKGSWRSEKSNHEGKLRAKLVRRDANHYRATFSGTFMRILPFRYAVTFQAVEQDGNVYLSGSRRLPMFGAFHFDAESDGSHFHAFYRSRNDHGTFQLYRVNAGGCCH